MGRVILTAVTTTPHEGWKPEKLERSNLILLTGQSAFFVFVDDDDGAVCVGTLCASTENNRPH